MNPISKALGKPLTTSPMPKRFNIPEEKAIQDELMRHTSPNKRVVPYIIPFVQASNYFGEVDARGRKPRGLLVKAGQVRKVPIIAPRDAVFNMLSIKYDVVSTGSANLSTYLGWAQVLVLAGSNVMSAVVADYPWDQLFGAGQVTVLLPSTDLILPHVYYDQVTVRLTPTSATTATMEVRDATGAWVNYVYPGPDTYQDIAITAGWMFENRIDNLETNLKVSLYAKSPTAHGLYGDSANVPAIMDSDMGNRVSFPHIERLYANSLQGQLNGKNQIRVDYEFPMDGTITIELQNIGQSDFLVNGIVYGQKIFSRSQKKGPVKQ